MAAGSGVVVPAAAQVHQASGRADTAELVLGSTTIVRATIDRARELKGDRAPGLARGFRRFLVEAEVASVLAAPAAVPGTIEYLVDLPEAEGGRAPRPRGADVLLFLGPEQRPGEFALAHRKGQQAWSGELSSTVQRFLSERASAPFGFGAAEISGAFHVPGTVPGESESQIFVDTAGGRPVSLIVLRRPGQRPHVTLATGDIIDPDAPSPEPDALASTIFACILPSTLPDSVTDSYRRELAADYAEARKAFGGCDRRFVE